MDETDNDEQIEITLDLIDSEYIALLFGQYVNQNQHNFLSESILTTNLFEMIIEMTNFFTDNPHAKYYTIHLVDRFYRRHLDLVIEEYKQLDEDQKENNSWTEIMKRLKKQISFRVATCIFISIKYKFRRNPFQIDDFLFILNKYGYECTQSKFKRSGLRVLREIEFDLNVVTLLDVVLFLQLLLKRNIHLNLDFYFPAIYDLIDLIYFNEFKRNDESPNVKQPRNFTIYACLVLTLIPVLINHQQSMMIFDELIDITKIDAANLINLRLEYLNIIVKENNH